MSFSVNCPVCQKKFKTGTSVSKHITFKHPQQNIGKLRFADDTGVPCEEPKGADLNADEKNGYLKWLSVLVERINASLVPDHPGKLCHLYWSSLPLFWSVRTVLCTSIPRITVRVKRERMRLVI